MIKKFLNLSQMRQRRSDCHLFRRWTLWLLGILGLRLVVILTFNDTALLLYLCDMQATDFQALMLQYIILDFLVGSFLLRCGQIISSRFNYTSICCLEY